MADKLFEAKKISAFYGMTQVLFDVDFAIEAGKITTILGANGAGKTSTLRALCQTIRTTGSMTLNVGAGDVQLVGKNTDAIVRMGVAHVPDGRGTFTALSVEDNLKLGAYTRSDKAAVARDMDKAYSRFPRLAERRHQQAGTLSGGEQQMLAISRALMLRPKLLLLDEPSFGLAPLIVTDIFRTMRQINAEDGVSMLLVEQNATLALNLAHHAYLLETGHVALSGSAEQIKNDESVRRAYLGY